VRIAPVQQLKKHILEQFIPEETAGDINDGAWVIKPREHVEIGKFGKVKKDNSPKNNAG
jgi:hypothetical protein